MRRRWREWLSKRKASRTDDAAVAQAGQELQSVTMFHLRPGSARIGHHDNAQITHVGVMCGAGDAIVRSQAAQNDLVDFQIAEQCL